MIQLLDVLKNGSVLIQLNEIKEHLVKLETELNEISKVLNCLSYDVDKYLNIILRNKSKTITNEKKLEYLESQYDKL